MLGGGRGVVEKGGGGGGSLVGGGFDGGWIFWLGGVVFGGMGKGSGYVGFVEFIGGLMVGVGGW